VGPRGAESAPQERPQESHCQTSVQIRRRLTSFRFPRSRRLTRWSDIQSVGREGRRIRSPNLELRFLASPHVHGRVAIVVPRYGRPVVERNRLRRLIRERLRIRVLSTLPALDLVIRALPSAYATDAAALRSELTDVAKRAFGMWL